MQTLNSTPTPQTSAPLDCASAAAAALPLLDVPRTPTSASQRKRASAAAAVDGKPPSKKARKAFSTAMTEAVEIFQDTADKLTTSPTNTAPSTLQRRKIAVNIVCSEMNLAKEEHRAALRVLSLDEHMGFVDVFISLPAEERSDFLEDKLHGII